MILLNLSIHNFIDRKLIKEYKFNEVGLNVILGDKREEKEDTNGVGKTNFVKYIHYLLGRDFSKEKVPSVLLENNIFISLKVKSKGEYLQLGRLLTDQKNGYILQSENFSYELYNWERLDNKKFREFIDDKFKLDEKDVSFAALREYIIRDEKKGYSSIIHKGRKATTQHKIFLSLFDLPNHFEEEINKITKEVNNLNAQKSLISSYQKSPQRLEVERDKINKEIALLEGQIKELDLREFNLHSAERYSIKKEEINKIRSAMFELEFTSQQFSKNIENIERKKQEFDKLDDLENFYKQLVGYFPEKVKKNFDEIQEFYSLMKMDRGNFFNAKITEIGLELEKLSARRANLEAELLEYTKVLNNTKFIDDIASIQRKLSTLQENLAEVNVRISDFERLNGLNIKIQEKKLERSIEIAKCNSKFKSYREHIIELSNIFKGIIDTTYGESTAFLTFIYDNNDKMNGSPGRIKIECSIPEEESHGRHNAKIRAVDLTWLIYRVKEQLPLTFLIHDGSFSVTDNSKTFNMLKYVHEFLINQNCGQYIVTLNRKDLSDEALKYIHQNNLIIANLKKNEDKNRFFGFGWIV